MAEKKTWVDAHKGEAFADNSKIEYCKICKDYIFRDGGTLFSNHYSKSNCMIYTNPGYKPLHVINNKGLCEYYSKD